LIFNYDKKKYSFFLCDNSKIVSGTPPKSPSNKFRAFFLEILTIFCYFAL